MSQFTLRLEYRGNRDEKIYDAIVNSALGLDGCFLNHDKYSQFDWDFDTPNQVLKAVKQLTPIMSKFSRLIGVIISNDQELTIGLRRAAERLVLKEKKWHTAK